MCYRVVLGAENNDAANLLHNGDASRAGSEYPIAMPAQAFFHRQRRALRVISNTVINTIFIHRYLLLTHLAANTVLLLPRGTLPLAERPPRGRGGAEARWWP
jgi:hypothetical protein